MIIYHFIDGNFLCSCSSRKKGISSSPPLYWEFRRFLLFVYEQYVNQHKLENPGCSKGKLSLSIHFLFSYTELFACHHKNHITAVIASFSLWVKAHKSQSINRKRFQVGRLECSGSQGRPQESWCHWLWREPALENSTSLDATLFQKEKQGHARENSNPRWWNGTG